MRKSKVQQLLSLVGLLCVGGIVTGVVLSYFSGLPPVGIAVASVSKVDDQAGGGVMNTFRAIFVTTPNIEVAKKIAHGLVTNRLAACVNIIPQITSVYEWEGKIEEDSELLLMIKTQSDKVEQIDKFVKDNHPYSVPEVIAVPIEQGSEKYLQWIKDTISGGGASGAGASS